MNKRKITAIVLIAILCLTLTLAACDLHRHDWSMQSNSEEHWRVCVSDGTEEPNSRAPHVDDDNDGFCDECGYVLYSGGDADPDHQHSFGNWQYDETTHWKKCSCGATSQQGAHVDENTDGKCDLCQKQVAISGHTHDFEKRYDSTEHWLECDCGQTTDHELHNFGADNKCTGCDYVKSDSGHTHTYVTVRDADGHWQQCTECGDATQEQSHTQQADYLCSCGYAYDAPATNGLESRNFWIIGTFTDNRPDGPGWGEYHNAQWKFHRLTTKDSDGKTQYVFEREFTQGDEFKIVNDQGGGYWGGEINAGHCSESSKKYLGGNVGGNMIFNGDSGYYRVTIHYGGGNASVDCTLIYAEGATVEPHQHSYSSAWSSDENGHWHESICDHKGLKQDLASHSFGSGVVCSVCGYEKAHDHVESDDWVKGKTEHYKICKLCGKIIDSTRSTHDGAPCSVCGYELAESGALKFELNTDQTGYNVIGYDYDLIEADVHIPQMFNNKPVVAVSRSAFANCLKINTLQIPDSVTKIDVYAFSHCSNLTEVAFGKNLETIETGAFEYTAVTSIKLPNGLVKIGSAAFEYANLTEVTIPASVNYIGSFAFRNYTGSADLGRNQLTRVVFENQTGWKVYPLSYEFDPTTVGESIDVTNAQKNAHNMIIVNNPSAGMDGYAQYIWVRG